MDITNIEQTIEAFRETLVYLVEQEKVRQEEISALNEKIDAVNDTVTNEVLEPITQAFHDKEKEEFTEKYGERLGKFDNQLQASLSNPEYDTTSETFEELYNNPEKDNVNVDDYVNEVESELTNYVNTIKESLGIPAEEAVEIKDDGEGNVEVVADENGDGTPETVVASEEETTETEEPAPETQEVPAEEPTESAPETQESEPEEDVIDDGEPSDEDIEKYLAGEDK